MAHERAIRRYRRWYGRLLRLYSAPYYERFGEEMQQTFGDVMREHAAGERSLFACALWVYVETSAGIVREHMAHTIGRNWSEKTAYRVALGVGLVTAFLLFWVNGAVGVIGSEGQPANSMYRVVFIVGLVGTLAARFKPRGMSRTLFAAALVQLLIPVLALLIWPETTWGGAGIVGVFILNACFAGLFAVSALLFRHAARADSVPASL